MGIGYTIDTPLKVAQYGISSVISLVDDMLIERMREFYSRKFDLPFQSITDKIDDFRAKRITAYLDLVDKLVRQKFEELKNSISQKGEELEKYFNMLPDSSEIKGRFEQIKNEKLKDMKSWLNKNLNLGSIDVNIMTKLDKENYRNDELLPVEYNDAHAALRGFAQSQLESGIVLSAGMNPRLYSYFENFSDFYPDKNGELKKKIILKVSDYRSALIQGKFLAKKGLWISEYRIESGLNCGGHAFATQGFLLGPILAEFRDNRDFLRQTLFEIYVDALKEKGKVIPETSPVVKLTAQGGVGTNEEHNFLLKEYNLDSIGWGTPFMLVPEICNTDEETLNLLANAHEEDLYMSNISPLGVPFNSIRNNTLDIEKERLISLEKPGAQCVKKYASLSKEFGNKAICLASRIYQRKKIKELDEKIQDPTEYKHEFDAITQKSCICNGLGTSVLLMNHMDTKIEGKAVAVCPGPNLAYFSEVVSLQRMTDHIYGRTNLISRKDRPHMFIKELGLYIDYLRQKMAEAPKPYSLKQTQYFDEFISNLKNGMQYYQKLFSEKITGGKNILEGLSLENDRIKEFS
ncbi:MAG: hypothetical protein H6538_06535 [Bacteroidales bacterium]|nr:hypothetical protein [Bacteroidales bacterium]MCB9000278.1 hypothetical protein [Bacteroidales bacterium]MCB9012878.1 hypothetical protein [Bacteroidales bacterium]